MSPQDRDFYVDKRTPPRGVESVPDFVEEDLTGQYAIGSEELKTARRTKRTTEDRLEHLENKYDKLVHEVIRSRTRIIVAVAAAAGAAFGYLLGGCL